MDLAAAKSRGKHFCVWAQGLERKTGSVDKASDSGRIEKRHLRKGVFLIWVTDRLKREGNNRLVR